MKKIINEVGVLLLVCSIYAFASASRPAIFSAGDSTMATQDTTGNPGRGWMQMFDQFVQPGIEVHNFAKGGTSSKSFRDKGLWDKMMKEVRQGDYVFIQFGHNDAKPDSQRHTDARTSFKANMIRYVLETQAKKANPILLTSIVRRDFQKDNKTLRDTHGDYVTVVREIADSLKVPLVDLNRMTDDMVTALGSEKSKALYMILDANVYAKYPEGRKDNTHLQVEGARRVAELAAQGVKELNLPLSKYIK